MKYFSPGLLDGSVTTAKLADGSVTTVKLADFAVTAIKVGPGQIIHEKIGSNAIRQIKIPTVETSLAGSVAGNDTVDLALAEYCFFPMIHVADLVKVGLTGHSVDSPGADNARLGLHNDTAGAETYDLEYRNVDP